MTATDEPEHQSGREKIRQEDLVPGHAAESRFGEQRRQTDCAELESNKRDEKSGEHSGGASGLMHNRHDDYSDKRKYEVVENRVDEHVEHHFIFNDPPIPENADEA